jgi:putative transposase
MARLARVVAAGVPHHVTQRGNRRQQVFFGDGDYALYRDLLAEGCRAAGVAVWAYCLMPNHVHLILVPRDADGLRAALGEAHRRYTRHVNFRQGWRGYLWQGRFASFPMDERYLLAAARYVELNPVRAGLARRAKDWRWSSARAHLEGEDDGLVTAAALLDRVPDWAAFLRGGLADEERDAIRAGERTGRPLGSPGFVKRLEKRLGRTLARQKPGPKPKAPAKPAPRRPKRARRRPGIGRQPPAGARR